MNSDCSHLKAISEAVDEIESKYFHSDKIHFGDEKLVITVLKTGSTVCLPLSKKLCAEGALAPLLEVAEQSPFGKGEKTVVDQEVRSALQLKPDQFSLNMEVVTSSMIEAIRKSLVPDTASIRVQLDKLNIYPANGHFLEHRDTPRSTDSFGSLVVALPVPWVGGMLTLNHEEQSKTFSWDRSMLHPDSRRWVPSDKRAEWKEKFDAFIPPNKLHYAAFFSDTKHSISTVSEGYRLTLSYTIFRDSPPDPTCDLLLLRAIRLQLVLRAAMEDPSFYGKKLGFKSHHMYEESIVVGLEKKLIGGGKSISHANAKGLKLKNEDAVIAVVCASMGLQVSCIRLLDDENRYAEGPLVLEKFPTSGKGFGCKRVVDGGFREDTITPDEVLAYSKCPLNDLDINILKTKHTSDSKTLKTVQYGEWFGNEASETTFYTSAIICVEIPEHSARLSLLQQIKPLSSGQIHVNASEGSNSVDRETADAKKAKRAKK